jgi:spore coat protein A, manganese oxidase
MNEWTPFNWTPILTTPAKDPRWKTVLTQPQRVQLSSTAKPIEIATVSATHRFCDVPINGQMLESDVVWGYGPSGHVTSPGPTLIATERKVAKVRWINHLPDARGFVEPSTDLQPSSGMLHPGHLAAAGHAVVHLHGAHVPWLSDGYPMRVPSDPNQPSVTVMHDNDERVYTYPFYQPGGATLWYHDHVMDATSRNVYAGLAGMVWLRHAQEDTMNLPVDEFEVPLMIQDRSFTEAGKVLYGDAAFLADPTAVDAEPSPEFKGDTITVNGKLWPSLTVKPCKYRFRVVNGSNSRIYVLRISTAAQRSLSAGALPMTQIGNDGGFLPRAVTLDGGRSGLHRKNYGKHLLILAPGERADLIVDFSGVPGGKYYLTNHALDNGVAGNPMHLGNGGDDPQLGTDALMEFKVNLGTVSDPSTIPSVLPYAVPASDFTEANAKRVRKWVIKEFPMKVKTTDRFSWNAITYQSDMNQAGKPGLLWAGTPHNPGHMPEGDPVVTENPQLGDLEVWEFHNVSVDVHPLHLHHSAFQVLERRNIKLEGQQIKPDLSSRTPTRIDDNEHGWKDTVRANPGQVTRILVRFDDAGDTAHDYTGHYIWHCHILEHEDMGMMRPLEIV